MKMQNKELNDFLVDILQDINEVQSLVKIIKNSTGNENAEITIKDINNTLELLDAKVTNIKISFEKVINEIF